MPKPNSTISRGLCCALALLAVATLAVAGQTRSWTEADYADFEKGISHNLSLRSDGSLTLAPRFQELYDTSCAYLWALAQDSKGNLFAGGGPGAKVFRLASGGGKKTIAELEGLEIHALAVDRQDRLYAATSPDGKIYRILGDGKSEVFYDPKTKYIWSMVFDSHDDLFVATGDRGEVHKVTPRGQGTVFFKTDEAHARSMAIDRAGNLLLGTEPGGLVMRVSPKGEGFVLYQMSKREVTAVAVGHDGSIWASAVGNKQPASSGAPAVQPAAPAGPSGSGGTTVTIARQGPAAPPPPTMSGAPMSVSGGSEVYRIDPGGNPRKMWTNTGDIVYAIAFDSAGRPLLGTGNKGYIYRIDSPTLYTLLLNGSSTQITGFYGGRDGRLYAVTGNVGKVYEIGPGSERDGTIESDVFDSGVFSRWGRLTFDGKGNGGEIRLEARSGNLDQPLKNWSPWSGPVTDPKGDRVNCPPARFVQWKATLVAGPAGQSPELDAVELAYLPRNIEPRIDEVEITPSNYRFPPVSSLFPASPQSLTLPPMGKHTQQNRGTSGSIDTGTPVMQYAKGWIGARWNASDENGDTLLYTVQIRGEGETAWKTLKENVRERYYAWDSTAFPDGEYRIRVTASDLPSNPPEEALSVAAESPVFLIDNTPPQVTGLASTRAGSALKVKWTATDSLTNVKKAEYSLDGGEWTVAPPVGGLADSQAVTYELSLENVAPGEHTIAVRVQDEYDNQSAAKTVVRE